MAKAEITKNCELLIIAGSETTATLLSGVTYFLLKDPDAYAKVKAEVRGAFSAAEEMTLASTSRLAYLQACLEEALRLYPPVPISLPHRTDPGGAMIDGHFIPGNVGYLY
jgi:cytochrome P450